MSSNTNIQLDPYITWNEYSYLEQDFLQCLRYLPLVTNHLSVWSFYFADILLRVGSTFDSFLKLALHSPQLNTVNDIDTARATKESDVNIITYYNIFEQFYKLSFKHIYELQTNEMREFTPFLDWSHDKRPEWWNTYNSIKHNRYKNREKATLESTINALGSLFLINVIHLDTIPNLIDYEVIRAARTKNYIKQVMSQREPFESIEVFYTKTKLFGYVYENRCEINPDHVKQVLSPSYPGYG